MPQVMANMTGTRLSFVVVPQEGKVSRLVHTWHEKKGIQTKAVEEPAGFLVYFPKGHVLRFRDKAQLRHYGLDRQPTIINMEGLTDPNSPLGKMMTSQDLETRRQGYVDLEAQVIALATAHSGKVEVVREAPVNEEVA